MDITEFIAWFSKTKPVIPEGYQRLLDNLDEAEGSVLHRNTKETDITNGWGIYKAKHPDLLLWDYVSLVGKQLGLSGNTKLWANKDISNVEEAMDAEIEGYLTYLFYQDFFKPAKLELFHPDNVILMANLYTNSPKGAWMSVQEAIFDLVKQKIIPTPPLGISGVDGSFGSKTKQALEMMLPLPDKDQLIFKLNVLLAMKTYYISLMVGNPDKFLGFGKGWDNRIENLQHI